MGKRCIQFVIAVSGIYNRTQHVRDRNTSVMTGYDCGPCAAGLYASSNLSTPAASRVPGFKRRNFFHCQSLERTNRKQLTMRQLLGMTASIAHTNSIDILSL